MLTLDTYVQAIVAEGGRFAAAVAADGADSPVPTCPGWTVRDLVLHQSEVHRWATAVIANSIAKPSAVPADVVGTPPDNTELVPWLQQGVDGLVAALSSAPDDLSAFTFLADAPRPQLFWARRQTHETEIHRVDAESVRGALTPFDAALAADGIDEMLTGFVPRPNTRLRSAPATTLAIETTDHPGSWHLSISDEPVVTSRSQEGEADCTVRGGASDVYLALWNRQGIEPLDIAGDPGVLELFRSGVKISWR